jgi:hypothetical protein
MPVTETRHKLTARDVLCADPAALPAALEHAIAEGDVLESLPAHLPGASATASRFVLTQAVHAIDGILGALELDRLLMGGWMQLDELQTALEETARDGDSRHVAIATHTIASEHAPSLELMVNHAPVRLLDLAVSLGFTVAACELVVDHGKVTGVEVGSVAAHGELKAAAKTILRHATDRLDLSRLFPKDEPLPEV